MYYMYVMIYHCLCKKYLCISSSFRLFFATSTSNFYASITLMYSVCVHWNLLLPLFTKSLQASYTSFYDRCTCTMFLSEDQKCMTFGCIVAYPRHVTVQTQDSFHVSGCTGQAQCATLSAENKQTWKLKVVYVEICKSPGQVHSAKYCIYAFDILAFTGAIAREITAFYLYWNNLQIQRKVGNSRCVI